MSYCTLCLQKIEHTTLSLKRQNIVDDSVANALRPPTPPSISESLETLCKNKCIQKCTYLDLSSNTLLDCSMKILNKYITMENFPNLQILNLEWNRIDDVGLYELSNVISRESFKYLCVVGNYCSTLRAIIEVAKKWRTNGLNAEELLLKIIFISELRMYTFKSSYP